MLGGFAFSVGDDETGRRKIDTGGRAKRLWSLIEYLIAFRSRSISVDELTETFWADKAGDNPVVTLQNNISRARSALTELGLPNARELIVSANGRYAWNPAAPTEVDTERFEALCTAARAAKDQPAAVSGMMEALELYTGDFLSGSTEEWVTPLRIYYRSLYTEVCRMALRALMEQERWMDVIGICGRAYSIIPEVEEVSIHLIRALTEIGQVGKALEHYETVKKMLMAEYGINPSEELELARTQAARTQTGGKLDSDTVLKLIREQEFDGGALHCDYGVFRHLVWRQVRSMARTHEEAQIAIINLSIGSGDDLLAPPATDMKRLDRVLKVSLRTSDPYARLSATQYIALLSNATAANADVVTARVDTNFRQMYPRSRARLSYKIVPLSASMATTDGS